MTDSPAASATRALIGRYYETFNGGDRPALLRLLHPEVVHEINQGGTETGRADFGKFLKRMDRCYAEQVEDLVVMATDDGGRAAAEFYIRGVYMATDEGMPAATGQFYFLRVGACFEVRNCLVARVTNYYNVPNWLRQIGAEE